MERVLVLGREIFVRERRFFIFGMEQGVVCVCRVREFRVCERRVCEGGNSCVEEENGGNVLRRVLAYRGGIICVEKRV